MLLFASIVDVAGVTATDATGTGGGAVTVATMLVDLPSLLAVIVAVPAATPWISPAAVTVAMEGADVPQVTVRSESSTPLASRSVAVTCTVAPTCIVGAFGASTIVATGDG